MGTLVQTGDVLGDLNLHAPRPFSGSVLWFAAPATVLAVAAAVLAGSANWQFVAGLVIAALVTGACGVVWWIRVPRTTVAPDLARLSTKIRRDWEKEAAARDLARPRPLRLSWQPTARKVQVGFPETGAGSLERETEDVRPAAHLLAKGFVHGTRRQLVVLGEPGAGKTTLAVLFTIAAASEGAVPVLLSASGWQPWHPGTETGEHVEDWIARRVRDDYQSLAVGVSLGDLLPVLDGLDEMPAESLSAALRDLNRAASIGLRIVITCRAKEFEQAVHRAGALAHADVVEVEPVDVSDAGFYLAQPEATDGTALTRWDPVLARLADDPSSPVAQALSTPLMISLARRAYEAPCDDPSALTRLATREEVEARLLDGFLATTYERASDHDKARRWLSFLAHHLQDRVERSDLEWWHLARAVPRAVLAGLVCLLVTAVGVLVALALGIAYSDPGDLPSTMVVGAIISLSVGAMAGVHTARTAHAPLTPPQRNFAIATIDGTARDLLVITAVLSGVVGLYLVALDYTGAFVWWLHTLALDQSDALLGAALVATAVVSIATLTNGAEAGRAGRPYRSTSRLRALPLNLALGLAIGSVFGSVWLLVSTLTDLSPSAWKGMWLMTTALIGVPLGISRWLAVPADWEKARSPQAVLRADRTATVVTAIMGGVCGGPAIFLALWATSPTATTSSLPLMVVMASMIAIALFFGSGSAWLNYTLARLWLAARGRLPWRLMSFLRTAHEKGVLRHTGPAYQLRHGLLCEHLANSWPHSNTPRRYVGWRPTAYLAAAVSTSLLAGAVLISDQRSPLHEVLLSDLSSRRISVAFSGDGSTLAAVSHDRHLLTLWNSRTGQRIASSETRGSSVGLSHDGHTMTEAVFDGNGLAVRRLNLTSGQISQTMFPAQDRFFIEELSPDGSTAAQKDDERVQVVDLVTGVSRDLGTSQSVRTITFSTNGKTIAITGSWDRAVTVIDADGRTKWTTSLHMSDVDTTAVSDQGNAVAVRDSKGVAHLWRNNGEGSPLGQGVSAMAFGRDSSTLALGHTDGSVTIWNTTTGAQITRWNTPTAPLSSIAVSPDGRTVATASEHGEVGLWTVPTA